MSTERLSREENSLGSSVDASHAVGKEGKVSEVDVSAKPMNGTREQEMPMQDELPGDDESMGGETHVILSPTRRIRTPPVKSLTRGRTGNHDRGMLCRGVTNARILCLASLSICPRRISGFIRKID
jgi:hypothetical protein